MKVITIKLTPAGAAMLLELKKVEKVLGSMNKLIKALIHGKYKEFCLWLEIMDQISPP
jgi:hypothetical protein